MTGWVVAAWVVFGLITGLGLVRYREDDGPTRDGFSLIFGFFVWPVAVVLGVVAVVGWAARRLVRLLPLLLIAAACGPEPVEHVSSTPRPNAEVADPSGWLVDVIQPTPEPTPEPTPPPFSAVPGPASRSDDPPRSGPAGTAPTGTGPELVAALWPGVNTSEAVRVVDCETGGTFDPGSVGALGELGWFQLYPRYHRDRWLRRGWTDADMFDPARNTAIAYEIYQESRWGPWSCKP